MDWDCHRNGPAQGLRMHTRATSLPVPVYEMEGIRLLNQTGQITAMAITAQSVVWPGCILGLRTGIQFPRFSGISWSW